MVSVTVSESNEPGSTPNCLYDSLSRSPPKQFETKKSSILAATLSIIPGLGRFYADRKLDGIMGFWSTYLATSSAYFANKNERPILGPLLLGIAGVTYFGEFYGAWRSSKYYQKTDKNKS